jgi:alpha-1,3-glucan synthase
VAVVLQNFWLSAPYGRNWSYLWSGSLPTWQVVSLIVAFFIGVWVAFLLIIGFLSKKHSWILPVFAIGLGAPRWCQMLWGTTSIGISLPWADIGDGMDRIKTGLLLGKSLWLWLGVLDAVQGVGFGMILLQMIPSIGTD